MINIFITFMIVFYRIPLINILGDKGMGYYSTALVIYLLFMTFISYGLPKAVSTLVTEHRSKGQYGLMNKTIQSSLLFALIASGLSALFLFLCADPIAGYLMSATYSSMAIRAFAPCLIFIAVLGVLHGIFSGTKSASISKKAYKIEEFFVAILSVAGAYIFSIYGPEIIGQSEDMLAEDGFSAFGAALGLALGVLIACIYLLIHFRTLKRKMMRLAQKDSNRVTERKRTIIRTLILTMLPSVITLIIFHVSSLLDYAIFNRIMSVQGHKESSYIILLGMLNGKYEFFISLPLLIVNWYASSKIPALSKIAQGGNKRKLQVKIGQDFRYSMLFVIPCTFLFIAYSSPLMNLFFTGNNDTPSVLLRVGAVSIIFYSLAGISNAALNALDDWISVAKNAFMSLIIQIVFLLFMLIVFQWGVYAVVTSRIVFSAALFICNENTLRERSGYVLEQKRTFTIPAISSLIMTTISLIIYIVLELFFADKFAVLIAIAIGIPVYIMALVFLGGITQREMYRLPAGKYLAPLCRKLHLIK